MVLCWDAFIIILGHILPIGFWLGVLRDEASLQGVDHWEHILKFYKPSYSQFIL